MMIDKRYLSEVALAMMPGVDVHTASAVLERLGDAAALTGMTGVELLEAGLPTKVSDQQVMARAAKDAQEEIAHSVDKHTNIILWHEAGYPQRLLDAEQAPAIVFTRGNTDINRLKTIGIVGTRHATQGGVAITRSIISELAREIPDLCVVSGLAYGIDVAAHRAAIEVGVPTVAVVAHGLDTLYPASHRDIARQMIERGGMVLTEYTHAKHPMRDYFLARNRLVAALSDVLVVVESGERGGALSTARYASACGRRVMAVPGRITDPWSQGCNALIKDGKAELLDSTVSLGRDMGWTTVESAQKRRNSIMDNARRMVESLNADERSLLKIIVANDMADDNFICNTSTLGTPTIMSLLTGLEMKGVVDVRPGNRYCVATGFPVELL